MDAKLTEQQLTEVKEALFRGEKISAIKIYRQATGAELSVAKAAVDKLEAELRAASPENFKRPERRGCLGMVLLLVVALAMMFYWL
jgi:ribosomal protein L7/L12